MKILELDIRNVRGLPDVSLSPQGRNLLIWGPNGSGKSGVVDAIDFLISGRIARLTGRGTGGITLAEHGPHIDSRPEAATVRALVSLPGVDDPVEIRRSMRRPDVLECSNEGREVMRKIEALARRGQHVLTRREILRYITAEPSNRAEEIQQLLDLSDVEELRRCFVTVANRGSQNFEQSVNEVRSQESALAAAASLSHYNETTVLQVVNENRGVLRAPALDELASDQIKAGVSLPSVGSGPAEFSPEVARADIVRLRDILSSERLGEFASVYGDFLEALTTIRANQDLLKQLRHLHLSEEGIQLLDGSGRCPLCDTTWDADKLREHLERKRDQARAAQTYKAAIDDNARTLRNTVDNTFTTVGELLKIAIALGELDAEQMLTDWQTRLRSLSESLMRPIDTFFERDHPLEHLSRLYAPDSSESLLGGLAAGIESQSRAPDPRQASWDMLTRIEDRLRDREAGIERLGRQNAVNTKAQAVLRSFQEARDEVLDELYCTIRDRFVEFYKILHDHEPSFSASLEPAGPGLDFRVDFLGHGEHPPQALHSEGHQDSMGICLFLALAERLAGGVLETIVLDDVVMSVDSEHRRDVCRLLTSPFPDKQFVLTTHDRTWAMQLKAASVVERRNMFHFINWTLETGPIVGQIQDLWERIDEALERGDVNDAAARLRRGCEQFFEIACDALRAPVRYNSDHRWDLDDWLSALMKRYRDAIKQAKSAAQSWGNTEAVELMTEQDSVRVQIFERCQVDRWAINPHVHYSNWANLERDEFLPVVQAFHDLQDLFQCSGCRQMLQLVEADGEEVAIKCPCGRVNWNLEHAARTTR